MGRIVAVLVAVSAMFVTESTTADTWGPATAHTIADVRVYQDRRLVFRFSPAVGAGCEYDDHGVVLPDTPQYREILALALTAFPLGKPARLIYNGCTGPANSGGVNVTGLLLCSVSPC